MLTVDELPYLTADIPGLGGRIKAQREDFVVHEVPLYEPSGEGTHVYFRIEKAGLPTMNAVRDIARALGRSSHDIGYAGLKDANAVTRQWMSIEHEAPDRLQGLQIGRIQVIEVSRHTNKLKLGHLKGNAFQIKLRDVDTGRIDEARAILDVLHRRGVPNYFGPQRFGLRGDTWAIGKAILRQDIDEAVTLMAGRVSEADHDEVRRARELFDQGQFESAAEAWPYPFHNERRLCKAMAKSKGNARKAFGSVDKQLKRFYLSAYQSILFNQIVAQRLQQLDRLQPGDLAWRHPQGAVFKVEDLQKEQPRCDAFEISPTGPLFGHRMSEPTGPAGEMEEAILESENLRPDDWKESGKHRVRGGRRPLRFQPHEPEITSGSDELGDYLELRFFLESGCYATTVLREILKSDEIAPEDGDG